MIATTLLTGTVSPSFTRISVTTPAAGEGISASTLSVEISNSGSSRSTASPTFLIQRTIVPSAIDSPICGITTGVGIQTSVYRLRVPGLDVNGGTVGRVRGFAHGLREGGMRVDGSDQLFHRALEPQRQDGFRHQFRRPRADHVHAENLVVLLVRDDLHESFGLARHLRASEHAKRERPDDD